MRTASGLRVRKHIRLRGHEYAGGATYSVTICAYKRRHLFGECDGGTVTLNDIGRIVENGWLATEKMRTDVVLDEHQVMPDHFHGIIHLAYRPDEKPQDPLRRRLFRIVGGFKSAVTSAVRFKMRDPEFVVWQPRFNDRIIRNDQELERQRRYIAENPQRWWLRAME